MEIFLNNLVGSVVSGCLSSEGGGGALLTEFSGLGGGLCWAGVIGKGFSKYRLMIESTRGLLGVDGRDLGVEGREGHGFSSPFSDEDDELSLRSRGRSELDRDDIWAE